MNNLKLNNLVKNILPPINDGATQDIVLTIVICCLVSILLFCLFFFILVLLSKKIYSLKNMNYKKKLIANILFGIVFSSISPLMFFLSNIINSQYIIFSQIVIFMLFGLYTSTFFMVGVFPCFLISNVLFILKNGNNYTNIEQIIYIILFFILAANWVFVSRFIFEKKLIYIFSSNCLFFLTTTMISFLIFSKENFVSYFILNSTNCVLFLVLYLISIFIYNLIDKTYKLKTSIKYEMNYFVNNGFSEIAFKEYIKKNNIEAGLMLTFDFMGIEKFLFNEGKGILEDVKKTFIKYIYLCFGNQCLYFKTNKNEYAIFLKIDKFKINLKKSINNNKLVSRSENDFLKRYELLLKKIPSKINYNNKEYNVHISSFCSIYGIHSNSFKKLVYYNELSKQQAISKKNKNIINLFSFENENNKSYDIEKYLLVSKKLQLDKAILKLEEKELINANKNVFKKYLFVNLYWTIHNMYYFDDIYWKINNQIDLSYTLRNFAYRALNLYKTYNLNENINHKQIIIDYSIDYLEKQHDLNSLIKKLSYLQLDFKNIIFNFNFSNHRKEIKENFYKNIQFLSEKKIKICFNHFFDMDYKTILKKYKENIDYIISTRNELNQKKVNKTWLKKNVILLITE